MARAGRKVRRSEPAVASELQRVHVVGIGGAGMSGIARILLDRGGQVSGIRTPRSRAGEPRCGPAALVSIMATPPTSTCCRAGATAVVTTHAAIPRPAELVGGPQAPRCR